MSIPPNPLHAIVFVVAVQEVQWELFGEPFGHMEGV